MNARVTPSQHLFWILTTNGCQIKTTKKTNGNKDTPPGTYIYYETKQNTTNRAYLSDGEYYQATSNLSEESEIDELVNKIKAEQGAA